MVTECAQIVRIGAQIVPGTVPAPLLHNMINFKK